MMNERKSNWFKGQRENNFSVAEMELHYSSKLPISELPRISCSQEASDILNENWDLNTIGLFESFKIILLNQNHRVLGIVPIGNGGLASVDVDPRLVFSAALISASTAIILAHNHPSGNTQPSEADLRLTQRLREGGKLLNIKVLDHIIITPDERFYSMADNHLI